MFTQQYQTSVVLPPNPSSYMNPMVLKNNSTSPNHQQSFKNNYKNNFKPYGIGGNNGYQKKTFYSKPYGTNSYQQYHQHQQQQPYHVKNNSNFQSNQNNNSNGLKRKSMSTQTNWDDFERFSNKRLKSFNIKEPAFYSDLDKEFPFLMKEFLGYDVENHYSSNTSNPSIFPLLREYLKDFSIHTEEKSKSGVQSTSETDDKPKTLWQERAEILFSFLLKLTTSFDHKTHNKMLILHLNRCKSSDKELESIINNYLSTVE